MKGGQMHDELDNGRAAHHVSTVGQKPEVNAKMSMQFSGRVLAVINPTSGNCDAEAIEKTLRDTLGSRLVGVHITSRNDNEMTAQQLCAQKPDVIFVAGGDGSIAQYASPFVGTGVKIFIHPVGTANILAKNLGIERDLENNLRDFGAGQIRTIDAIKVGNNHYFSHVSIGIYSKIAQLTTPVQKQQIGRLAYIWNGFKLIKQSRSYVFDIEIDGNAQQHRASTVMIANAADVGGLDLEWGPDISPSDQVLNVSIIKAATFKQYLVLLYEHLRYRNHSKSAALYKTFTDYCKVSSSRSLPVRGDGEIIGSTPATMMVVPKAIDVLLPATLQRAESV